MGISSRLLVNKDSEHLLMEKERYLLLYKLTPVMMLANFLAGSMLVGIMWGAVSHQLLLFWLASLLTASALTLLFYSYLKPFYQSLETIPDSKLIYYLLPFFFGCIWGAAGYFFLSPFSMTDTAFLIVFLFGMVSGGVSGLSVIWSSYIVFAVPLLLPFSMRLIMAGYSHTIILGCVTLSYLVVMILISKLTHNSTSKSLSIRHKNTHLIHELQKQTQVADKSSQDKSRFLAAASHDLRQPVHTISLLTSAIAPEIKTDRGKKILQQMNHANDVMLELLNSLLNISKLDAGIIKPELLVTNVNKIILELADEFKEMADKNGLELRIRTYLYHIKTDPVLLSIMLRNLIQNALLYTKKGKVLISCRKKGNKILIQVWDTGRGIAEENQHIIFEEFQQLNNPERDQNKGLGLGLSICKRLADLLKIDFSLKSQLGKGSVFSLEIPILSDAKVEALSSQKVPFKLLDENPKYHEQVILLILIVIKFLV